MLRFIIHWGVSGLELLFVVPGSVSPMSLSSVASVQMAEEASQSKGEKEEANKELLATLLTLVLHPNGDFNGLQLGIHLFLVVRADLLELLRGVMDLFIVATP